MNMSKFANKGIVIVENEGDGPKFTIADVTIESHGSVLVFTNGMHFSCSATKVARLIRVRRREPRLGQSKLIELIPTAGFEKADAIAPPFLVRPLRGSERGPETPIVDIVGNEIPLNWPVFVPARPAAIFECGKMRTPSHAAKN